MADEFLPEISDLNVLVNHIILTILNDEPLSNIHYGLTTKCKTSLQKSDVMFAALGWLYNNGSYYHNIDTIVGCLLEMVPARIHNILSRTINNCTRDYTISLITKLLKTVGDSPQITYTFGVVGELPLDSIAGDYDNAVDLALQFITRYPFEVDVVTLLVTSTRVNIFANIPEKFKVNGFPERFIYKYPHLALLMV